MPKNRTSFVLLATGSAIACAFACTSVADPTTHGPSGGEPVAPTSQALDPTWTPHAFDTWTQGWYLGPEPAGRTAVLAQLNLPDPGSN